MSENYPFKKGKRYNWVAILNYVKEKLAQKAKEETIIAGLVKQAGGKWTKRTIAWAKKCIEAKTVEEFKVMVN